MVKGVDMSKQNVKLNARHNRKDAARQPKHKDFRAKRAAKVVK